VPPICSRASGCRGGASHKRNDDSARCSHRICLLVRADQRLRLWPRSKSGSGTSTPPPTPPKRRHCSENRRVKRACLQTPCAAWPGSLSYGASAEEAVTIGERAVDVAASVDEQRRVVALHDLGAFQSSAGRTEQARRTLRSAADSARVIRYASLEADAAANLALLDLYARDFASAYRGFRSVLASRRTVDQHSMAGGLVGLGWAALGLDRRQEAREAFGEALDLLVDAAMPSTYDFARAITGIALAAEAADARLAARLRGAGARLDDVGEFTLPPEDCELDRFFERPLLDTLGAETYWHEHARGRTVSLEEAIDLAESLRDSPHSRSRARDPLPGPASGQVARRRRGAYPTPAHPRAAPGLLLLPSGSPRPRSAARLVRLLKHARRRPA
jgi:hypothetical protein